MSQKLLIFISIFFLTGILNAFGWKFYKSLETGPSGIHLQQPMSIYIDDKHERFYVSDTKNSRFISFDHNFIPLKEFNAAGGIKYPVGMIKDSDNNIWAIERATNSIVYINLKEKKIVKKSLGIFPDRICKYGNLIVVVDRLTGDIVLLNKNFEIVKILSYKGAFNGFFDVKVKGDKICGMENLTGRIFCFNMKNSKTTVIQLSKKPTLPVSFDFDSNGNLYILDRYQKRVLIYNSHGIFMQSILKSGERQGNLYYPWGIIIKNDKMFIIDEGNGRIDIFKK